MIKVLCLHLIFVACWPVDTEEVIDASIFVSLDCSEDFMSWHIGNIQKGLQGAQWILVTIFIMSIAVILPLDIRGMGFQQYYFQEQKQSQTLPSIYLVSQPNFGLRQIYTQNQRRLKNIELVLNNAQSKALLWNFLQTELFLSSSSERRRKENKNWEEDILKCGFKDRTAVRKRDMLVTVES